MNKKYFILAGILAALVVAYIISEMSFKSSQKTFDPDILKIDSASVAEVVFVTATGDSLSITNTGNAWKLRKGSFVTIAAAQSVGQLLSELGRFRIDRLASDSEEDLEQYNLSDSLRSQIIVRDNDKNVLAHLLIGNVSYQPKNMYGQQTVDGITYFQINGDDHIYAAMSFLGMMVTLPPDNWRDHSLLQCDAKKIKSVTVKTPEGGFALAKDNRGWKVDGKEADTVAVQQFIGGLSFLALSQFENTDIKGGEEIYSMQVETTDMPPVKITGYQLNDSTLLIRSTANPELFRAGINEAFVQNFLMRKGEAFLGKK